MPENAVLQEVRNLFPKMLCRDLPKEEAEPQYLAFSDASQGKGSYDQTWFLSELYLPAENGSAMYHVLDWFSCKHARVSFSAICAEILAAALSADIGKHMASCLKTLVGSTDPLQLVLFIDSDRRHPTIITLYEGEDYPLKPTVSCLYDSFGFGQSDV